MDSKNVVKGKAWSKIIHRANLPIKWYAGTYFSQEPHFVSIDGQWWIEYLDEGYCGRKSSDIEFAYFQLSGRMPDE